jgi:hypothetical protein
MPVIAMEPLRGGKLASGLPEKAARGLAGVNPGRTPAEWALRWLWDKPEVTVVLSGMSSEEHTMQNIKAAKEAEIGGMTAEEQNAVKTVTDIIRQNIKVNCTSCGYCMPCPANVDIPEALSRYNESALMNRMHIIHNYMMSAGLLAREPHFASQCTKCGVCEPKCPQDIKIIEELKKARKYLEPFWVRGGIKIARKFMVKKPKERKS